MEIKGTGVVVTGASRGLGAALAKELSARGAKVVLVARGEDELQRVAAEIRGAGGEAHAIAADIADKHAVHGIAYSAAALVGAIDLLVNNASSLGPVPLVPLLDTACEALEDALAVNVVGPFRLTKIIAGSMAMRRRGLVVNVSSDAAVAAYPAWGAYGASKAAMDHLGRIWDAELAATGVRVVSVDPGEMNTRMHADAVPDANLAELLDPATVARRIVTLVESAGALAASARVLATDSVASRGGGA